MTHGKISRRGFITRGMGAVGVLAGAGAVSLGQSPSSGSKDASASQKRLKVKDVDDFLRSLDPSARGDGSPDGIRWGDAEMEVRAAGVTWMASMPVLQAAVTKGVNLMVVHEPTLWFHGTPRRSELEACEANHVDISFKTRFLSEHGIAVIRAHNCWDLYPKYGIEASLQAVLELPDPIEYLGGYHHLYRIPKTNLEKLTRHCKAKLGLPCVRVSGDLAKPVERIVMAYGASSNTEAYYRFWRKGADAVISGEQVEWSTVRPAIDMGMGVIELGHSNTEAFGMKGMAQMLQQSFPGLRIEYLPSGDSFQYL